MSTDEPYNSLGQILSAGGEIALGLAIANNYPQSRIADLFARRFEPMRPDDRQQLMDIANAAVNAARNIDLSNPVGDIDVSLLPTIPELFGENSDGRRGRFVGRVDFTGEGDWRNIWVDLADINSEQELADAIRAKGKEFAAMYPERFGIARGAEIPEPDIDLLFGAKAF